jgi:hypothetical protein
LVGSKRDRVAMSSRLYDNYLHRQLDVEAHRPRSLPNSRL